MGVRGADDLLRSKRRLLGCVLLAFVLSGCGGSATVHTPSAAVQRDVADRFADAVFRGDAAGARALLVSPDEGALVFLVRRAAAPWRRQHVSIRLPARHTGERWTFSYAGRRTHEDGRFETEKGDLVVDVAPSASGAGVRFFGFRNIRIRFSTHHDSQLLPSNR